MYNKSKNLYTPTFKCIRTIINYTLGSIVVAYYTLVSIVFAMVGVLIVKVLVNLLEIGLK